MAKPIDKKDPELIKKLTEEAKQYTQLKPARFWYSSYYHTTTYDEGFIISKTWMNKWKKYVNYNLVKRGEAIKEITEPHPGEIDNKSLLRSLEEYYHTLDSDDILNTAMKSELRDRFHFSVKPKPMWEFLFKIYGGIPINRKIIKNNISSFFDFDFQMIDIIILPKITNWDLAKITKPKPMYVHKNATIAQCKERMIKIFNQQEYGFNLSLPNFRIWRLESNCTYSELQNRLNKYEVSALKYALPDGNKEGCYGMEFPGYSLGYFESKTIDHVASYSSITVVIEQADDTKFLFTKLAKVRIGSCESCREDRPLLVECKCKEAYYCSQKCLENDKMYHNRTCTYVEEEKFKDYKKSDLSSMGITGLHNLGIHAS